VSGVNRNTEFLGWAVINFPTKIPQNRVFYLIHAQWKISIFYFLMHTQTFMSALSLSAGNISKKYNIKEAEIEDCLANPALDSIGWRSRFTEYFKRRLEFYPWYEFLIESWKCQWPQNFPIDRSPCYCDFVGPTSSKFLWFNSVPLLEILPAAKFLWQANTNKNTHYAKKKN
jgi:hypothetical protein